MNYILFTEKKNIVEEMTYNGLNTENGWL